jgi:hypothetical protein
MIMQKYGLDLTVRSLPWVGVRRISGVVDHAACGNFSFGTDSVSTKVCTGVLL